MGISIFHSHIVTPRSQKFGQNLRQNLGQNQKNHVSGFNQDLHVLSPGYLAVDESGKICEIAAQIDPSQYPYARFFNYLNCLLLPGMIDTHTHLSQFSNAGIGESQLLPWLEKYTFPQELKFADPQVAQKESQLFFRQCARLGTTTVVPYVTSHAEAVNAAFEEAQKSGLRAFLGQVLMNRNGPEELLVDAEKSLLQSRALAQKWHLNGLLQFVVSPRFAIS